ncbi:ester cyclase [Pseudonocardia spinosispora]|uniref:ester cyclase n=1 Tax=Pseudonocardia spinosispora TaxID=103441 RepID=UPI0009FFB313|nr:nuclear transport factor 2 family protein [Pseudonocardia spinosispora]
MERPSSVEIVEAFWDAVWNGRDPERVDDFVVDDFVITSGGERVEGRENFKAWVAAFLATIDDLELEVVETFQNHDGSRVASRWRVRGRNNGILGTVPDGQPLSFTGTAVWAVREDGKLLHNWVERASWELYGRLTAAGRPAS